MSSILKFIRENHILALIEQAIAKKKSKLSLNAYEIVEIPNLLYTCLEIEYLYLHRNKIRTLTVQLTGLVNLTTLTLDYNNISALPPEIGNLKNLVNFNISYNPIKVLVPEIGDLENLEAFWCNRIGLQELPKEIGKLTKLDTFGARGNELKSLPSEMGHLTKLRWLTLDHNQIESIPSSLQNMESLVHCNLKNNQLKEFPECMLKCGDLIFLQLNNNEISCLPEDFDTSFLSVLEMIDMRDNPICELTRPDHPLVRYSEELPTTEGPLPEYSPQPSSSSRGHGAHVLAVNSTQLRLPATPPNHHNTPPDDNVLEMDLEASSAESSEDWENSINSSELDIQYQSEEERADNEAVGMVLPELSKYASTAS